MDTGCKPSAAFLLLFMAAAIVAFYWALFAHYEEKKDVFMALCANANYTELECGYMYSRHQSDASLYDDLLIKRQPR